MNKIILGASILLAGCMRPIAPSSQPGTRPPEERVFQPQFSTEVGAGGSGVLCEGGEKGRYFEVLDVYEARKREMAPDLGPPQLSVEEKMDIALKRLEVFSPLRAKQYRERAREIIRVARYFTRGSMPHIGDDDPIDLEEGCKIVQIATRKKPIFPGEPEFIIDQKLLDRLDNDNRAALFLHEVVYEEAAKEYKQQSSRFSRGFLSTFLSPYIEKMSLRDFFDFLVKVEFTHTDFGGIRIPTNVVAGSRANGISMDGNRVISARWPVKFQRGDLSIEYQVFDYFGTSLVAGGGLILEATFSEKGRLRALFGYLRIEGSQTGDDGVPSGWIEDRGNLIRLAYTQNESITEFDDEGRFRLVTVAKGSRLNLKDAEPLLTEGPTCVLFSPDGTVESYRSRMCSASEAKTKVPHRWQ